MGLIKGLPSNSELKAFLEMLGLAPSAMVNIRFIKTLKRYIRRKPCICFYIPLSLFSSTSGCQFSCTPHSASRDRKCLLKIYWKPTSRYNFLADKKNRKKKLLIINVSSNTDFNFKGLFFSYQSATNSRDLARK